MCRTASPLSVVVFSAFLGLWASSRLVAQPLDLALEIESVEASSEIVRVRVFVNGLITGKPWYPEMAASFRWDPERLRLLNFTTRGFRHHLIPSLHLAPDEGGLTFVMLCGFICLAIDDPECRQPVAEVTLAVLAPFGETSLDLLDFLIIDPSIEPFVEDQASEVVYHPSLFDSTIRLRPFVRGDMDGSGSFTITDAIRILQYLFLGPPVACPDPADADDDGDVNVTDAIYLLRHLFVGGPAPPPPSGEAGLDPTDDGLDCAPLPGPGICEA
jgi:hypothetical protein